MQCFRAALASACVVASLAGTSAPATSLSGAVEIVAEGFSDPVGVAVDHNGSIVVSDQKRGAIVRIAPNGQRSVLVSGLERPAGVAFDPQGDLIIVEERGRRVLRRRSSGLLEILASGIIGPRWVTVAPDGTIYLSAVRLTESGKRSAKNHGRGRALRILALLPSGELRTIASGFRRLEGLVWTADGLYAAVERIPADRGKRRTWLVRVPIDANGAARTPVPVASERGHSPAGVAIDGLGALFVASESRGGNSSKKRDGAVLRPVTATTSATVLRGLHKPQGLAFEPTGDLLVVEGGKSGRLLRLYAPDPPSISAPMFTNRSPIAVAGRASPGQRIEAFDSGALKYPFATTHADPTTGAFTLPVPLTHNANTSFSVTATAGGGLGLASAPASRTIVHDNRLPQVVIQEPPIGAHVRALTTLGARGDDDGSGLTSLVFMLDDATVATTDNPAPSEPLVAVTPFDTRTLAEGQHTLTVVGTDRADNAFADARLLVVDRTPPDVRILSGPGAETADTTATFMVMGTDTYSPTLNFSWRLDESTWSPFGPSTTIVARDLPPGVHTFEVRARDLAGNETTNFARQTFTVTTLRVRITEPVTGAVVTTPTVWLRGFVEGGSEVAVTIPLPPGMAIPSLPASMEGNTFAVEVTVDSTTTTLTAQAIDVATGATASDSVDIVVLPQPTVSLPKLTALPAGGFAPHVVTFSLNLAEGSRIELDLDSDGTVDFDGTSLDGLPFFYERPGIYVPTLRATTSDGQVHTYRTVVDVYDRVALDARLQRIWRGFSEALQRGEIERAVGFVHEQRRTPWREYFEQLSPADLATQGAGLTTIELIRVGRGGAEYEMLREEGGRVFSYPVALTTDVDGQWRLWQF